MKYLLFLIVIVTLSWQEDSVKIAHYRRDVVGKTKIGNYDFSIDKTGDEDNIDMINRGYDSAKAKAKELGGTVVYINGRRWRFLGRKLVVITEIYKE